MPPKKKPRTQSATVLERPAPKGGKETKKALAKRLLEGDGVEKNEEQAVSLLEECVARGDAVSMLTLARCCAFGRGTRQDAMRAEELLSGAAAKGNKEAQSFLELIHEWKGLDEVDLKGLEQENKTAETKHFQQSVSNHRHRWCEQEPQAVCLRSEHRSVQSSQPQL